MYICIYHMSDTATHVNQTAHTNACVSMHIQCFCAHVDVHTCKWYVGMYIHANGMWVSYIHAYSPTHACIPTLTHIRKYTHSCMHLLTHPQPHTCTRTPTHTCMIVGGFIHACTNMPTHLYTHTPTHAVVYEHTRP
jgi:hypothetical protein